MRVTAVGTSIGQAQKQRPRNHARTPAGVKFLLLLMHTRFIASIISHGAILDVHSPSCDPRSRTLVT